MVQIKFAYSELCLILACIFKKYDLYDGNEKQRSPSLELFEIDIEDVDIAFDILIPFRKQGSLGDRLRVR
jgi:hypothetical protein